MINKGPNKSSRMASGPILENPATSILCHHEDRKLLTTDHNHHICVFPPRRRGSLLQLACRMRIPVSKTNSVNSEQQAISKVISGLWCYHILVGRPHGRRRGRGGALTCLCSNWQMNSGSSASQTSRSAIIPNQSASACASAALCTGASQRPRTCVRGGAGRGAEET